MWISRDSWETLEKRVTDLEVKVQGQNSAIKEHIESHMSEVAIMEKALEEVKINIVSSINAIKNDIVEIILRELEGGG